MIIGIMGSKGHGKDTLGREILGQNLTFKVTHWADPLKDICMEVFGLTSYDVHDPKGKETLFPKGKTFNLDEWIPDLQKATGLTLAPRGLEAKSPREILQYVGTEYVRAAQDSYWVDKISGFCKTQGNVLIPDTRYPNECQAIRDMGGVLVWVERIDLPTPTDTHVSENSVSSEDADMVVENWKDDFTNFRAFSYAISQGWIR